MYRRFSEKWPDTPDMSKHQRYMDYFAQSHAITDGALSENISTFLFTNGCLYEIN
jgi:hypothetical protein